MQTFEFLSPSLDFDKRGFRTHRDDVLDLLHTFLLSSEACSKSYFSSKHAIEIGSLFFWQTVLFSNQGFPILARI